MICDVCQSDRLAKNDLGFLICDDCGTQSFAATQEESEFLMGEGGARQFQRIRKVKPSADNLPDTDAPLVVVLRSIQAALFVQCCAVANRFGVNRTALLRTAGDLFLAYFESVRRDYDGRFRIRLAAPGLHHRRATAPPLPEFKVHHFITIDILAVALNVLREPLTPLDLFVEIRLGHLPTQDVPKLLPPDLIAQLTGPLFQFLAQRSLYLDAAHIERQMRVVYDRARRVMTLPELRPVSGNVPLTLARHTVRLQLPTDTVAPLAQALLDLHLRHASLTKAHAVAVVLLAAKLLFGSRSPSPLDSLLNSTSSSSPFVPVTQLCAAPDPDAADFAAVKAFTKSFLDFLMVSQRTRMAVGDAFDEIVDTRAPRDVWDLSDSRLTQPCDDFAVRDDDRCLCWYEDPARGGQHRPINVPKQRWVQAGGNRPDAPEWTRLVVYDRDEWHLGHCVEHHLHRRLFQLASDLFDLSHRDLDRAYRQIIESVDNAYPLKPWLRRRPSGRCEGSRLKGGGVWRARPKTVERQREKKRLRSMLAHCGAVPRTRGERAALETLRSIAAQQRYLQSCLESRSMETAGAST